MKVSCVLSLVSGEYVEHESPVPFRSPQMSKYLSKSQSRYMTLETAPGGTLQFKNHQIIQGDKNFQKKPICVTFYLATTYADLCLS